MAVNLSKSLDLRSSTVKWSSNIATKWYNHIIETSGNVWIAKIQKYRNFWDILSNETFLKEFIFIFKQALSSSLNITK